MQNTKLSRKFLAGGAVLLSLSAVAQAQLFKISPSGITGTDGGAVTAWDDTGSGNSDLTPGGGTGPTFHNTAVNGSSTIGYASFDSTVNGNVGNVLSSSGVLGSSLFGSTDAAIFMVIRPTGANDAAAILGWDSGGTFFQVSQNSPSPGDRHINYNHGTFPAYDPAEPSGFSGDWQLLTLVRNGNSGELRIDGQSLDVDPTAFTGQSLNTGASGTLRIGNNAFSQPWTGDIAEIRIYGAGADISGIESELGAAYNLAPVPEPSQYATVFSLICVAGALVYRHRRQRALAS